MMRTSNHRRVQSAGGVLCSNPQPHALPLQQAAWSVPALQPTHSKLPQARGSLSVPSGSVGISSGSAKVPVGVSSSSATLATKATRLSASATPAHQARRSSATTVEEAAKLQTARPCSVQVPKAEGKSTSDSDHSDTPKRAKSDWVVSRSPPDSFSQRPPSNQSSTFAATTAVRKPILTSQVGPLADDDCGADIAESTLLGAGLHIQKELGRGNQSSVHLARHLRKGSYRCVKRFDKKTITANSFEFMKAEYGIMQKIGDHPHVAEAFNLFQDSTFFYMELAYYKGGDFTRAKHNATSAGVFLNSDWWSGVFNQCFEALAHLHDHGVMHCDVKEPNIMFKTDKYAEPSIVLIDFGVAQTVQVERTVIYGTPGYIAPEVWENKNWKPESDMFSLGVVMLQMLADRVPNVKDPRCGIFVEGTASLREIKVATQSREPPFAAMPRCHSHLELLARVLLAKDAALRPTAAQALSGDWMFRLSSVQPTQRSTEISSTPSWALRSDFDHKDKEENVGRSQVKVVASAVTTIASAFESLGTTSFNYEFEHSLE